MSRTSYSKSRDSSFEVKFAGVSIHNLKKCSRYINAPLQWNVRICINCLLYWNVLYRYRTIEGVDVFPRMDRNSWIRSKWKSRNSFIDWNKGIAINRIKRHWSKKTTILTGTYRLKRIEAKIFIIKKKKYTVWWTMERPLIEPFLQTELSLFFSSGEKKARRISSKK